MGKIRNENLAMSKNIGKIIKERLKSLGKTQNWLAEASGVSNTAVSKWIASGRISRESATIVAKLLEVSLDTLLLNADTLDANAQNTLSLVYVDTTELKLLTAYRESTELGKALITAAAEGSPRNQSASIAWNNKS